MLTEVDGVLTREMLGSLDNFGARMWDDLSKLTPAERARRSLYYNWAEAGAKLSGVDHQSFNTMWRSARRRQKCSATSTVISPVSPVVEFRPPISPPRSATRKTVRAHLLHRAVEHVGKSGRLDQRRLQRKRLSDRRSDHRPPLRRPRRARHSEGVRGLRGPQKPWPKAPKK